jgi:hypothetical protein
VDIKLAFPIAMEANDSVKYSRGHVIAAVVFVFLFIFISVAVETLVDCFYNKF